MCQCANVQIQIRTVIFFSCDLLLFYAVRLNLDIIGVRLIIFHSRETFVNSELGAVIVNNRFHFFLEKK